MALDLSKIQKLSFPNEQYIRQKFEKKQIYVHHTASGRGTDGDFRHWLNTPQRIATCVIVDYKGVTHQCFSSKWWGYHLGIKSIVFNSKGLPYIPLDKYSIGIEIDAWGGLTKENGVWRTYTGKKLDKGRVVEYPEGYRGFKGFEVYTDKQLREVEDLLVFWNQRYGIPLHYNEDMWDVSRNALSGKKGVYSHTSVRKDKSDIHPQPEMIQMLKGLKSC